MAPLVPCLACKRPSRNGTYCPEHEPQGWRQRPSASSRAVKRPGWNKLREACLRRDGYRCVVCGATESLQAHHVIPAAEGGPNVLSNLETRCRAHNPT